MSLATHTLRLAGQEALASDSAKSLLANGGQLVDVRSPADFNRGALPGALNLPVDALTHDSRQLDKHEPVILYGMHEVACVRAARLLAGQGFLRIYHLHMSRTGIGSVHEC
ncbi:MAG: rhodanese-like domain-containing protein [Gammaproteobacteria bacterium]|nr:rhodanese-like domain-containing protein [Gammaproteobacteria bacterium]